MTIAEHERAAREDRAKAAAAADAARAGGRGAEWERSETRRHELLAAEHADAARKLEQEVRAACPSGPDRFPAVLSSLRIAKVDPIYDADVPPSRRSGRGYYPERLQGVRLAVLDGAGASDEIVESGRCASLQALAGTATAPESASSPFAIPGAATTIQKRGDGASVEIRAKDPAAASEILRRSEMLATGPGPRR